MNNQFTYPETIGMKPDVRVCPYDALNLDEIKEKLPPVICAVECGTGQEPSGEYSDVLKGKNIQRVINAEKYIRSECVADDYMEDLCDAFEAGTKNRYVKNAANKARKKILTGLIRALLPPLVLVLFAIGFAVLSHFYFSEYFSPVLTFSAILFIGILAGILYFLFKRKPNISPQERLSLYLLRKKHKRHTVILKHVERLSENRKRELFAAISGGLRYNPFVTLLLTDSDTVEAFQSYFQLKEKKPTASKKAVYSEESTRSREETKEAEMSLRTHGNTTDRESGREQLSIPQKILNLSAEAVSSELPAEERLSEEPQTQPKPESAQEVKFDFENAGIKSIADAMHKGILSRYAPYDILAGCLPKISRMSEKSVNDFLTTLQTVIDAVDFKEFDFPGIDGKTLNKFADWLNATGRQKAEDDILDHAVKESSTTAIAAVISYVTPEKRNDFAQILNGYIRKAYESGQSFSDYIPALDKLFTVDTQLKPELLASVGTFGGTPSLLTEKPNFAESYCFALALLAPEADENALETVYNFTERLLKSSASNTVTSACMKLITAYKDKFRFAGMSIDNLNNIIFDKDFESPADKLEYIDNLLTGNDLTAEEKTRCINYLISSKDTFEPHQIAIFLSSLIKGGENVEEETVLETVKVLDTDRSENYAASVAALIAEYFSASQKNTEIFTDILNLDLSMNARAKIISLFLKNNPYHSQKVQKHLLALCLDENKPLALDNVKTVLCALGRSSGGSKFPKNELIDVVGIAFDRTETPAEFEELIRLILTLYDKISLNGDQKHDLKSSMFKAATKFQGCDFGIATSAVLEVFKIEYISFTESKIAHREYPEVVEGVKKYLEEIERVQSEELTALQ